MAVDTSICRLSTQVDCFVLKYLDRFRAKCNNCFPQYYYFSRNTSTCYNEFINSTAFSKHVSKLDLTTPEGIDALKEDFMQVSAALPCEAIRDKVKCARHSGGCSRLARLAFELFRGLLVLSYAAL